jgi:hypothetical protein
VRQRQPRREHSWMRQYDRPRLLSRDTLPLAVKTHCSPVPTSWRHSAAVHHLQAYWVRISHPGHADCGQVVRARQRIVCNGELYLKIELPDGRQEQILQTWTEDPSNGGSAVPALLFSPSSLRALVQWVRQHGRAPSAETGHGITLDDNLETPARGSPRRNDAALGRAAAPARDARRGTRRGTAS